MQCRVKKVKGTVNAIGSQKEETFWRLGASERVILKKDFGYTLSLGAFIQGHKDEDKGEIDRGKGSH